MLRVDLNLFQFNGVTFVLVKFAESGIDKFVGDGQLDVEFLEESTKELSELFSVDVTISISIVLGEIAGNGLV